MQRSRSVTTNSKKCAEYEYKLNGWQNKIHLNYWEWRREVNKCIIAEIPTIALCTAGNLLRQRIQCTV